MKVREFLKDSESWLSCPAQSPTRKMPCLGMQPSHHVKSQETEKPRFYLSIGTTRKGPLLSVTLCTIDQPHSWRPFLTMRFSLSKTRATLQVLIGNCIDPYEPKNPNMSADSQVEPATLCQQFELLWPAGTEAFPHDDLLLLCIREQDSDPLLPPPGFIQRSFRFLHHRRLCFFDRPTSFHSVTVPMFEYLKRIGST